MKLWDCCVELVTNVTNGGRLHIKETLCSLDGDAMLTWRRYDGTGDVVMATKDILHGNHNLETSAAINADSKSFHVTHSQHKVPRVNVVPQNSVSVGSDNNTDAEGLFCSVTSDWNLRYFSKTVRSNMSSWTFEGKVTCPKISISKEIENIDPKVTFSLRCGSSKNVDVKILGKMFTTDNILRVDFGNRCLATYINNCCKDNLPVPNVVHYVIYGKKVLSFFEFVSFISVIRFIRPCVILIHGDALPKGNYWNYILTLSPNIVHVKRKPPSVISRKKPVFKEHASDIMRIEALLLYGGIYLDTDTLIVKPLNRFRKYPCTISQQSSGLMSSAFLMAEQNSTYLQKWLDGYKNDYRANNYIYNAMVYPKLVAKLFKGSVHVDYGKLSRPWREIGAIIYKTNCNWKDIHAIHLFSRSFRAGVTIDLETVKHFNSTVGAICRHVLYGNKEMCLP